MRPWIVIGDLTSHNGRVLSGSQFTTVDGKPVARIGDHVSCPKCGNSQKIVEGDQTIIIDGQPVAREGNLVSCGARLISVKQQRTFIDNGGHASGGDSFAAMFFGEPAASPATADATDEELAAAAYGDPAYWTASTGTAPAEAPRASSLDDKVIDSIMSSEGASGMQGGRPEAYGFRQGNGPAYDEIMAARSQYGQGSPEERAIAARYLTAAARQAGALNFTDPGKQAAIMSMAHMRGVGGAQAIINSMTTGDIERSGSLTKEAISNAEAMPNGEFQDRLRDARTAYDKVIYGSTTTTTVDGRTLNFWDRFGGGLQKRYRIEAEQFKTLSGGTP